MGGTNRNISVRAVGDFSNLSQGLRGAQNEIQSFGDRVKAKFKEIGEIGRGIKDLFEVFKGIGESVGELANRAAELDGGMSSLNRTLGQSAVGYMEWANSTAKSFGISKMSAIEYGKSIAMLLGDVYKDQGQLAAATEQLMQGGAVIAAKTGKSQQEVYEELNSALMGHAAAVKSLDINIMENALVHSQAYKQIANGTPWAQLTAEQQQYIRVTELNRQIQQKFGDTIGSGMDARLMLFKGALDDLKTGLAEAFMPILYRVLPILSTFLGWINTAISYVAAFFQVLFGYSGVQAGAAGAVQQHADAVNALGDAYASAGDKASSAGKAMGSAIGGTKKAAGSSSKKTKDDGFLASFDQVHTISKPSDTSGGSSGGAGGGGAGGGAGGIPDMANPLANIGKQASGVADNLEKFREKVAGFANAVKGFFQGIGSFISEHKALIISILAGIGAALLVVFGPAILGAIVSGVVTMFESLIVVFGAILSPVGLIAIAVGVLVAVFVYLYQTNKTFHDDVLGIWNALKKAWGDLVKAFGALIHGDFSGFIKDMKKVWEDIKPAFQKAWNDLWKWLSGVWSSIGNWFYKNVGKPIEDTWNSLKNSAANAMNNAWDAFKSPFVKAADWFHDNVVSKITNAFQNIVDGFQKGGIIGGLKAVINDYIDYLNGFVNGANAIIHKIPMMGGVSIPNVPHLATGGITQGPTYALIGEAGTEVVSPLGKLQDYMASTITNAIMTAMSMQNGKRNNVAGDIILNIDGKQFARIIKPYTDLENKRIGTNIRLQSL